MNRVVVAAVLILVSDVLSVRPPELVRHQFTALLRSNLGQAGAVGAHTPDALAIGIKIVVCEFDLAGVGRRYIMVDGCKPGDFHQGTLLSGRDVTSQQRATAGS